VLRAALASDDAEVVQAVVDPNDPELPGHVTVDQAWHFAESCSAARRTAGPSSRTWSRSRSARWCDLKGDCLSCFALFRASLAGTMRSLMNPVVGNDLM
jgi:hypothetical protein